MIRSLMVLILLCLWSSLAAAATGQQDQGAVYDDDDRLDYFESTDDAIKQVARESVVALMSGYRVNHSSTRDYYAPTLGQAANVCSDEPFRNQPVASFCSGVLIAPDLVLTAGHCIWDEALQCQRTRFIFNYRYEQEGRLSSHAREQTYACREVLTQAQSTTTAGLKDWAIIQLDRPVDASLAPARLRSNYVATRGATSKPSPMTQGEPLLMIGFPMGLPMKIDAGGRVENPRSTLLDAFVTTVDAFGGNSGSGVWHRANDGEWALAGILVSGDQDFVEDSEGGRTCQRSNMCTISSCLGENVIYLDRILADFCQDRAGKRINHPLCGFDAPLCGDGFCDYEERHGASYCTADCGPQAALSVCGDGYCSYEEYQTCPQDCVLTMPDNDRCDPQNYGTYDGCHSCTTEDPDCDMKNQSDSLGSFFNCQSADPSQTTAFGMVGLFSFAGLVFLARRRRRAA